MTIVIRVAGDARVGFGHVRRMWTLAETLRQRGAAVHIVAASADAGTVLARAGFSVTAERSPGATAETRRVAVGASVLVVDDPTAPTVPDAAVPVVAFDDTGESDQSVALVVNGSVGAEALAYPSAVSRLLGPRFIVLRPAFAEPVARRAAATIERVIVLGGGGHAPGLVSVIAHAAAALPRAMVDVVVGPFGAAPRVPAALASRVRVCVDPPDIRALMLAADVAVSGGGQTAYELAATATPTLGVRLADNQRLNLTGLAAAGCLEDVGAPDDPTFAARVTERLRSLDAAPATRQALGDAGRRAVDGQGAARVADSILTLAGRAPAMADAR
ncbi:MAG: hypothetical protein FJ027_16190 [Candidatus Rokubacteria bacterium]|nr:hypothetical protein [Candidatus Rokubacteria bacterium]